MKCNPLRWLWALPVIALVWWLSQISEPARIEADLQNRTQQALKSGGLEWALTGFSGRDAQLRGRALDEGEQGRALQLIQDIWGVRVVEDRSGLVEEQKTYSWTGELANGRVLLAGFVPNASARRAVNEAAKQAFPGRTVEDAMKLARGAPKQEQWLGATSFALRQLVRLKDGGRVSLSGLSLSARGEAVDFQSYEAVRRALGANLPAGVDVASDEVLPPAVRPYTWQIATTATQVELSGHIPSELAREAVLAQVKTQFPKSAVVDRMVVAGGAPGEWRRAAAALIGQLGRIIEGRAELSDEVATLKGTALKEETAASVMGDLGPALPRSFKGQAAIGFRQPSIPVIQPYVTSLTTGEGSVVLEGYVPSEDERTSLIAAVERRLPGRSIDDRLRIGTGQSDGWRTCVLAGLEGLSALLTGRAELTARMLKVSGVTDIEDVGAKLAGTVRAAANRACDDQVNVTVKLPPEPVLTWRAERTSERLVLDGEVTDSDTRTALVASARRLFPNVDVVDQMRVKPARSAKWPSVAQLGLALLSRLRSGEASISGLVLSVEGVAPDAGVVSAVQSQLQGGLVRGYRGEERLTVKSDAMVWAEQEARRKAESDRRRRQADEAARTASAEAQQRDTEEARRRADEEARRTTALEAERQAEAERRRRAEEEAAEARRKADEEARRKAAADAEVRRREAQEAERRAAALAALARRRDEASRCEANLNRVLAAEKINFARASADIDRSSHKLLNELARLAKQCPGFNFEIEGHTDAEGTDERNARLSARRAAAVAAYLTGAGVPGDRLTPVGVGSAVPIAPNDTAEGRAQNRRIEFKVKAD